MSEFYLVINILLTHARTLIVISGTNPIFNMFSLGFLKNKVDFKWLLFGYDIFPENLIPGGVVSSSNCIYKISKVIFSRLYSSPDEIVAVGRDMKNLLLKKTNNRLPIHYIPNWSDHNDTFPVSLSEVSTESTKVTFQFFGNIGRLQDVDNILKAIPLVKSKNAFFSFVWGGGEVEKVINFINNQNDHRVVYKGPCPIYQKNETLSLCNVALVSLKPEMYGLAVPSKSYFSLAANKPLLVVGDSGSELRTLVNEYNLGWECDAGSPAKLANLIDEICASWSELSQIEVRDVMINNFSESRPLQDIHKVISQLGISKR